MTAARTDVEAAIRARCLAGDVDGAAADALAHYGPELYGFVVALARDEDLASEAFALASEQLWRNLARFRWQASLRTWAYQLVRHALIQVRADPRRRAERNLPLSLVESMAGAQRSATAPYQRTDVKDGLRALREALDPLDHELLVLRLDRAMSWKDIARALAEPRGAAADADADADAGADADDGADLDQRAAALRKRFERAKAQLRELAVKHGLLGG